MRLSSHFWARELSQIGHELCLIPPSYIKPYATRGKNEAVDSEAICEAMSRLAERKSGYAVLHKLPNKIWKIVGSAIIKSLRPISDKVQTVTFYNGRKFSDHAETVAALQSITYFADPFSSWQRESNENLNGLVRQYIPNEPPLSTVSDKELAIIQDRLNNRPRKRLSFETPNEVFQSSDKAVAPRG